MSHKSTLSKLIRRLSEFDIQPSHEGIRVFGVDAGWYDQLIRSLDSLQGRSVSSCWSLNDDLLRKARIAARLKTHIIGVKWVPKTLLPVFEEYFGKAQRELVEGYLVASPSTQSSTFVALNEPIILTIVISSRSSEKRICDPNWVISSIEMDVCKRLSLQGHRFFAPAAIEPLSPILTVKEVDRQCCSVVYLKSIAQEKNRLVLSPVPHSTGKRTRSVADYSPRADDSPISKRRHITDDHPPRPSFACRPIGLVNIGNTCYVNAALQCLLRVKSLTTSLTSGQFRRNPNNPLGSRCRVLDAYVTFLRSMHSSRSAVSPDALKRALGGHNALFADHQQHDATEFFLSLLDAIHEDLNESPTALGRHVDLDRYSGMELHRQCNKSIVSNLFHGEMSTVFTFPCGRCEEMHESLVSWELALPSGRSALTLEECIQFWQREEQMKGENGIWCDRCGCVQNVRRRSSIAKFAPVIIVRLKRFKDSRQGLAKNNTPVSYPFELDSRHFAHFSTGMYDLTGVICHAGTLHGGHYTCVVREAERDAQWYHISDNDVTLATPDSGHQRADWPAMTLLYQARSH
jgi:ubiquitin C-terminal hydrolase